LLGRSGGPRGPSRRGLCCVHTFGVRFEVCLRFVFFAGFKQDSPPGFLGDPHGCPRQISYAMKIVSVSSIRTTLTMGLEANEYLHPLRIEVLMDQHNKV
jgi:hypothetical protein